MYRKWHTDVRHKILLRRKPGLPILMVKMPDSTSVPYWNTFYQETYSDNAPHRELMDAEGVPYLGQRDLNIRSGLVWDFYRNTLKQLIAYGAGIVRLDAFAYAPKAPGRKNMYYQVNATYYSALGESDKKLLSARAVQLFMAGKPQVWNLDLFAGKNDHNAVARAGENGHKEINRTNLTTEQADKLLKKCNLRAEINIKK